MTLRWFFGVKNRRRVSYMFTNGLHFKYTRYDILSLFLLTRHIILYDQVRHSVVRSFDQSIDLFRIPDKPHFSFGDSGWRLGVNFV